MTSTPHSRRRSKNQGTDTTTPIPGLGDKASDVGSEIIVAVGGKTIDIRADSSNFARVRHPLGAGTLTSIRTAGDRALRRLTGTSRTLSPWLQARAPER